MTQKRGTNFDHITNLPSWSGVKFVPTRHHDIPQALHPNVQRLPSPFVAVVTGASRGIGRGTAKAFALAGATGLILTARKAASLATTKSECEALATSSSLKITTISADNAEETSALAVAKAVREDHGGQLNLLVNNAGILNVDGTAFGRNFIDMDVSNIEETMRTNYFGRFYMIKHLLPLLLAMPKDSSKSIINVSSIGSQVSGPLGFSISALATNRLSQRVTEAYGDQGIFCAAVHPGAVLPEVMPVGAPDIFKEMSTDDPMLCGAFLIWLVKQKRDWLNGRYIDATWDVDELEKKKDEIVEKDMLKMRLVVS
jgi:NAD(P)-dependent dehydrogenase (short-subunit alcohol dehydrogenase family)